MKIFGNEKTHLTLSETAERAYSMMDPLQIIEHEDDDGNLIYSMRGIIEADGLTEDEVNACLEREEAANPSHYYWTAESWGSDYPPKNWEEIIDTANDLIDRFSLGDADGEDIRNYSGKLWEEFCRTGKISDVTAEYEEEE